MSLLGRPIENSTQRADDKTISFVLLENRRKEIGIGLVEVNPDSGDGQSSGHRRHQQFPAPKFLVNDLSVTLAETRADLLPDVPADFPEVWYRRVDDPVEEIRIWLVDVAVERVESGVGVQEHVLLHHVEVDLSHFLIKSISSYFGSPRFPLSIRPWIMWRKRLAPLSSLKSCL